MSEAVRIITGSYEHNLLCVALTLSPKGEVFTPVFHFTPHSQSIRCLATTRRYLVSGSNDELIRLYDLQRRRELGTLAHHSGQVIAAEFSTSGRWLLTAASDGAICVWRTRDWEVLAELKAHKKAVSDISVHHSGRLALSVGEDRKLVLWNLMTARKASVQKLRQVPRQVAWVPEDESNRFVIGYDNKVALHRVAEPERTWELATRLYRLKFWREYLVVSTNDGSVTFYTLESEEPAFTLKGHASRVKDFSFLGHLMVSVSSDGAIVVWDLNKRDQVAVYQSGDRLNCVLVVPDEIEKLPQVPEGAESESGLSDDEVIAAPRPKKKRKAKVIVEQS